MVLRDRYDKQYSSGDHWHLFVKICIREQKWGQFFHIWSHLSQSATSWPLFATQLCHFWARHTFLCTSMQFWLSAWSMGASPKLLQLDMSHKSWSKAAVTMLAHPRDIFLLLAYFSGIEKAWNGLKASAALRPFSSCKTNSLIANQSWNLKYHILLSVITLSANLLEFIVGRNRCKKQQRL